MRYINRTLLGLIAITLFSCQKEIDDPSIVPGNGNNGGGNGNSGNYQPLTSGSWWIYKDSASGSLTTLTAINYTKTINSILYRGVKSSQSQIDTGYQAAPAPNYYMYQKGVSPNNGAPYDLLFNYLNDTASVGYNWTYNAGTGNGFTAYIKTTIIERGITVNVAGNNFSNVIHTRLDFSYDILGGIMDFGFYDFYTAKNVGIVRIRAELGAFGVGIKSCSDLVDHHIQ